LFGDLSVQDPFGATDFHLQQYLPQISLDEHPSPDKYDASSYIGLLSGLTVQDPVTFGERGCVSVQALFVTDPTDNMMSGADCRPTDKVGCTPLHRAVLNEDIGVTRILLDDNANTEAKDSREWTALMLAATVGNLEITRFLLARSALLAVRDMEGCTPLHHAAASGRYEIVKLLLEHGSDLEAMDNERWSVLHHAAWNGHDKITSLLLETGADLNAKADNSWTALHQASWNGHGAVVRSLLQGNADPNETDDEGETALHPRLSTVQTVQFRPRTKPYGLIEPQTVRF